LIGSNESGRAVEEFVRGLVAEILDLEKANIDNESSITSTPGWDSFAHAELCQRIGDILDQEVSDELVEQCTTLPGIILLLAARENLDLSNLTTSE